MTRELTRRQGQILQFIIDSIRERGYPPTIAEIGEQFKIASTNGVNDHLRALERKGYIKKSSKARGIVPVNSFVSGLRNDLRVATMRIAKAVEWASENLGEEERAELLILLGVAKVNRRGEQ